MAYGNNFLNLFLKNWNASRKRCFVNSLLFTGMNHFHFQISQGPFKKNGVWHGHFCLILAISGNRGLCCMSEAIRNAAKAEVACLDRRLMQSYPLIYQSSAALNESNAQISRGNSALFLRNVLTLATSDSQIVKMSHEMSYF